MGQVENGDWQKKKTTLTSMTDASGNSNMFNEGFLPGKSKGTNTILNNYLNLEQTHKRSSHKCLQL